MSTTTPPRLSTPVAGNHALPPAPPQPHRRWRRLVVLPLLAALALALWLAWPLLLPPRPGLVASGTIEYDEVVIAPEVTARIVELPFDDGARVQQGEVVARLDDSLVQLQYRQALPAERQQLDLQLQRYRLTSPIDGVVARRALQRGELARAGDPILTVAPTDPLLLTVYIPEPELGRVQVGGATELSVAAYPGRRFPATVRSIASRAEFTPRNVQTASDRVHLVFAVKLRVPNPEGLLRPGMFAEVRLPEGPLP